VLNHGTSSQERAKWSADGKIVGSGELSKIRQEIAANGKTVVFTNGSFDLLHAGHVRYLHAARSLGDYLFVGLNSDKSVKSYKGPDRPIVGERDRAELLAALGCVDYVVLFDEPTAENMVGTLRPDIYVKGGDYTLGEGGGTNRKELPEAAVVLEYGGKVEIAPLWSGLSTTELIRRIQLKGQGTKEA
jgi:D-glycero-beta-D-manno-heptose 1-phosphate adenylyltransferase